ncbi:MAG: hypothetical protein IJS15_01030, partial [Victivallales bacterium]|nr:hypothetical protein [Victivallales bacterium]
PDGSAWQSDRIYRVQGYLLNRYFNYMAVHVWSLWGLGGIVGPPVLKAAPAPPDAQWEVAFVSDEAGETVGLNAAETSEEALDLLERGKPLEWTRGAMPWRGYASWKDGCHYAAFRMTFDLKDHEGNPRRLSSPVVVDMGPVFDVAAFYLNGRRVGRLGRFPEAGEPAFTEAAGRGQFVVEPGLWAEDGRNEIAVVVYRERGSGGLSGVPGILLANPLEGRENSRRSVSAAFGVLLQSNRCEEAKKLLGRMECRSGADKAWRLSHLAHLVYLEWLDGGRGDKAELDRALAPMAELFGKLPDESPRQSAMQAFCRVLRLAEHDATIMEMARRHFPAFGKTCRMLPSDRTTQGDWPLFYGNVQTILPAYGKLAELVNPLGDRELYKVATGDPDDPARRWQPRAAALVADSNAHIMPASQRPKEWESTAWLSDYWRTGRLFPGARIRRAAWWDDHGEMHPFDDEGPDLTVTLGRPIAKGQMLSLHLSDYDWRRTLHPRQQSIVLFDDSGRLLDACWSGKSDLGVYERFVFAEEAKVRFKVLKHRGACVALSGVFIDAPGAVADDTAALVAERPVAMTAQEALSLVAAAERTHSLPSAIVAYRGRLAATEDFDSVLWLAAVLARSHGLHHVWMALAAGRLMELKGDAIDDRRRKALKSAAEHCGLDSTVPFMGLMMKLAEE